MASFYQNFYEKCYFPFFEGFLKKRETAKIYRNSLISQWQSTELHRSTQLKELNRLIRFAAKESTYYSIALKTIKQLASLDSLPDLPILTKSIIHDNFDSIVPASRASQLWRKSTGGSTGQPLHFGYTKESYSWRTAMSRRGYSWAGAAPGSKQAYIWGIQLGEISKRQRLKEKLHQLIERQQFFNCFDFGEKEMKACLDTLNSWQPHSLIGYTNPLYEFALYVDSIGGLIFRPQSILCAAEKVQPFQRKVLERVFDCPVFNTYGSREFMLIAAECEKHEGLHVNMENLIVEVVNDDGMPVGPGETGRILVTDLHNYGMPFIRYEIGDMARIANQQCSCGRGLVLLDDIIGRSLDVIRTPRGKMVPGEFFPHLMKDFPEIYRFQVVQKKLDEITITYQLNKPLSVESLQSLKLEIRNVVGETMHVNFVQVDTIPLTPSGKYRVTISELDR